MEDKIRSELYDKWQWLALLTIALYKRNPTISIDTTLCMQAAQPRCVNDSSVIIAACGL
jgi:hypothetical protein